MGKGTTPGYREISKHYEHLIRTGQLKPGHMLPKEPVLAKQHKVTRTTLRKAFALLVAKGLVIKKRGQGTFIASASSVAVTAAPDNSQIPGSCGADRLQPMSRLPC